MQIFLWALAGTSFVFLMTCLGSGTVFFFRKAEKNKFQKIFLGFAAGVMIAASIWSLIIPAINEAEAAGHIGWIPVSLGFVIGVTFLFALDKKIPHLHPFTNIKEGASSSFRRSTLLISAVTLHNIPEGMAVGLAFALAAQHNSSPSAITSAIALAIGIGIQNLPEGAAISLPLKSEGIDTKKSFALGCLSGAPELLFGMLTAMLASLIAPLMPILLSFAAGAMMYVVVEELIPESHIDGHSHIGTISVMAGFLLMMILDIALG